MKKLITILIAILVSLIPTMTRTQPIALQTKQYEPTVASERTNGSTAEIETEPIVTTPAEPEVIATEPPVTPVDAPCTEIPTDTEEVHADETAADTGTLEADVGKVLEAEETVLSDETVSDTKTEPGVITIDEPTDTVSTAVEVPEEPHKEAPTDMTCVDNGNSDLAPYTPADGQGTPNPFANTTPTAVKEIDAEDIIQPGDDRPGEGIHF